MKAMIAGFLAIGVIALLADLALDRAGFGSDAMQASGSVRLR